MDGVRLHRLGKRLIDLARQVTTDAGDTVLTPGEVAVLEDVLKHPGSVITEIQARTGFAQSHVSTSVSRLRDQGLIVATPDPDDRRASRLRPTADGTRVLTDSHKRMVSTASSALGGWSEEELAGLASQLERLRADFATVASIPTRQEPTA